MFNKKAQPAMEFMLTWGWSIIVVLVLVFSLTYFGVLNPFNFLPKKCAFSQGISCRDFNIDDTNDIVNFVIKNNLGWPIREIKVSIPGCIGWNYTGSVKNGESFRVQIQGCPVGQGKLEIEPQISYIKEQTGVTFNQKGVTTGNNGNKWGTATMNEDITLVANCPQGINIPECRYDNLPDISIIKGACFYGTSPVGACTWGMCNSFGNCV